MFKQLFIWVTAFFLMQPLELFAGEVHISTNTTWTGVVNVSDHIIVDSNAVLTVKPGCQVVFKTGNNHQLGSLDMGSLTIHGRLNALGIAGNPIVLKGDVTTANWGIIFFDNADSSLIKFCNISNSGYIQNLTTGFMREGAVTVDSSVVKIENCRIEKNLRNGVEVIDSDFRIVSSLVAFNGGTGIFVSGIYSSQYSRQQQILNCIIAGNLNGLRVLNYPNSHYLNITNSILDLNTVSFSAVASDLYRISINNSLVKDSIPQGIGIGNTKIFSDQAPLFKPRYWDQINFKPRPNSPVIDRGDTYSVDSNALDLGGNRRIVNGRVDIGCHEFQGKPQVFYAIEDLYQNTLWNADTVIVIPQYGTNLMVNGKLDIAKGTKILFANQKGLSTTSMGRIRTFGEKDSPVVFSIKDTTGFFASDSIGWLGIQINSMSYDTTSFRHTIFQFVKSADQYSEGGALRIGYSSVGIEHCIFRNNYSSGDGGAIKANNSTLSVIASIFQYNYSGGYGGAIYCRNGSPFIANSLFHHNKAKWAGAMAFNNQPTRSTSSAQIINCTITENIGMDGCGGFKFLDSENAASGSQRPQIINTIIHGNMSPDGSQIWLLNEENNPDFINSLVQGGVDGFAIDGKFSGRFYNSLSGDPKLTANYNLKLNSPCIDRGFNDVIPAKVQDLNGAARIFGNFVDMGCFEVQEPPLRPVFVPKPGFYAQPITAFIENRSNIVAGSVIHFTTDGSEVTQQSAVYSGQPIVLAAGQTTINAKIYFSESGKIDSSESVSGVYTIGGLSGNVKGVFKRAYSPYLISSMLTVSDQDSLIIEPGVEIIAKNSEAGITINGKLISLGERNKPVVFRAQLASNGWQGLRFSNNQAASLLNYTIIRDGRALSISDSTGGGISLIHGKLVLSNCQITNNLARSGGGIALDSSSVLIADSCLIAENRVQNNGGGILVRNSNLRLRKSQINSNGQAVVSILNNNGSGGGIYAKNSQLFIAHNDLLFNNCNGFGGGIFLEQKVDSQVIIQNNNICNNSADEGGGGLRMVISQPLRLFNIDNNTFNRNSAVQKQTVLQPGAAISVASITKISAKNLILWDNQGTSEVYDPASNLSINYSNVYFKILTNPVTYPGNGNINQPPLFVKIPNMYGAPAAGIISLAGSGFYNYHLHPTSPCIDSGDPEQIPNREPGLVNRVNMGSYGNTMQADLRPHQVQVGSYSQITCFADTCYVLNTSGRMVIDQLIIQPGSRVYVNSSSDLTINSLYIDGGSGQNSTCLNNYSISRGVQTLIVNYNLNIRNADLQNLALDCPSNGLVNLEDVRLNNDGLGNATALKVTNGGNIILQNSTFNSYNTAIDINNQGVKSSSTIELSNLEINGGIQLLKSEKSLKSTGVSVMTNGSFSVSGSKISDVDTAMVITGSNSASIKNNRVNFTNSQLDKIGFKISNVAYFTADSNQLNNSATGFAFAKSSGRMTNSSIGFAGALTKEGELFCGIRAEDGSDIVLSNNEILDSSKTGGGTGIYFQKSSGRMVNNSIGFAGALTKGAGKMGIVLSECSVDSLYHNSVVNSQPGLMISGNADSVYVINNIFWQQNDLSANQLNIDSKVVLYNNDISGIINYNQLPHQKNINSDPGFKMDSTYFDFELTDSTSQCINSGRIIDGYHQVNGNYYGSAPDMGAKESAFGTAPSEIEQQIKNLNWELCQNYPNPFNPATTISYTVPYDYQGIVKLKIFNIRGQLVAEPLNNYHKAGIYHLNFNASSLSSGVYLYQLQGNNFVKTKKMIVVK